MDGVQYGKKCFMDALGSMRHNMQARTRKSSEGKNRQGYQQRYQQFLRRACL